MIPPMTDPLGKYWSQPQDIREAPMDDETVLLTLWQFESLEEYSNSIPSGVYFGKCWKGQYGDGGWYLRWYGPCDNPKEAAINIRNIEVVY